jgi:hypothetical protein
VIIAPAGSILLTADGSIILTADGSSILTALQSAQEKAFLRVGADYLHDEGIRLRIGTNGTAGGWALEAFELAYQMLPGLKRRDQ